MNNETLDIIHTNWKLIFHAYKKIAKPELDKMGITKVDANLLLSLKHKGEMTKSEIASYLSFTPNSLTRSMDRLIEQKWIARNVDDHDNRYIRLSLTQSGDELVTKYQDHIRRIWRDSLSHLPESEVDQFAQTLLKISHHLLSQDS